MAKTKIGTIVSDKMEKTAIVAVHTMKQHPLYHKKFRVTKRFKVGNPDNKYKAGEAVVITETKPMSKEKSWIITARTESKEGGK